MMWWTTLALAAPPPDLPVEPALEGAVQQALSLRHPVPCERVVAGSADPVGDLLAVVDGVVMPPWAPMRAADCLVLRHSAEAEVVGAMRAWLVDPERRGLARLVVSRLDRLEADLAVELATRRWQRGLDRAWTASRLRRSERAAVRAVVDP